MRELRYVLGWFVFLGAVRHLERVQTRRPRLRPCSSAPAVWL